ncbi:hypothetical protein B0A49_06318 [Cryomyces minteri]|uniref:Pentacotripeptide-repeat region of PRORP domain-containing protein n=1 Tax=Cryomyces minteri TaxID=331657 RepID=A0A4V5NEZ9_9PEZI|nr:hypothetical protein B0A49_06318 [Cryomyces minteri]
MPRLVQKQLYGLQESHVEVVTDLIERLFNDPAVEQYISVRSLNAALSFLVKHSNVGLARTLMLKTDRLNIRIASESFNILLRGAAVARDLFNYNLILQMMIKRKVTPNAGTWTALIMTIKPLEIRMHILRCMQEKGLLFSPRAMKGVAEHIIEEGAPTFFSTGRSASQYITQLDELFGRPAWMNESGANRMVDVLGAQGRMEEAKQVLSTLYTRGYLPKVETINTFLIHCTRHNNERAAVQLLVFLKQKGRMPLLDERSFEILFKLAWNGRRYNMTRVVWRYACIWGRATHKMQERVTESIERDVTDLDTLPVLQKWKATAGKIAAGIPPITMYDSVEDIYEADALTKRPPTDTVQLMQRLARALGPDEEDAGAQVRRRKLAKHMVHEDMKVVPRWKSRRGLADMLAEAFEMDCEWSHGGKRNATSTEWKIEHAIVVPVWDGRNTE